MRMVVSVWCIMCVYLGAGKSPLTMCDVLQVAIGYCPREHTIPSCGSDTIGACDTVTNVVGEACDCHCSMPCCSVHSTLQG